MKQAKSLVIEQPVLDGVWIDLNYPMRGKLKIKDSYLIFSFAFTVDNEGKNLINMEGRMTEAEKTVLDKVKRSFPYW